MASSPSLPLTSVSSLTETTSYPGLDALEKLPMWDGKRIAPMEVAIRLLAKLGNPQDKIATVHVAGTNGKGSVCAYVSGCLWASGKKVGQFASPHLGHVTERCLLNGVPVAPQIFDSAVSRTIECAKLLDIRPSYFVASMAASFLVFAEQQVDVAVIEVGVGGMFDATNIIIAPQASVITHIGFDHMNVLGSTIQEIARNKAGIIKSGVPVFVGANDREVLDICREVAREKQVEIFMYGEEFSFDRSKFVFESEQLTLPLAEFSELFQSQARCENIALATRVALFFGCTDEQIYRGLKVTRWPGRMETFKVQGQGGDSVHVLLDGMHNRDGAPALLEFVKSYKRNNSILNAARIVFAMRDNKDWTEVVRLLNSELNEVFAQDVKWTFTGADLPHMVPPDQFLEEIPLGAICLDSREAFRQVISNSSSHELVVVAGSLYMLGNIRPEVNKEPYRTIVEV